LDTPAIEHSHDHRAEFLERVLPNAIEQFWPRYMTHADSLDSLLLLRREVERIAQKNVPVSVIARVVGYNRLESLSESNFLHQLKTRVLKALRKIIGKPSRATAVELARNISQLCFDRCRHCRC